MATTTISPSNSWWGTGTSSVWTNSTVIYSGTPSQSGNYRSKISFTIPSSTVISKSIKLTMTMKLSGSARCCPSGCMAVLTKNNSIDADDVQNTNATAPSTVLSSGAIATSPSCKADGVSYPSGWVDEGTTIYFYFDTTKLKAGKTYYVYLIRTSTENSWVHSSRGNVSFNLSYDSYSACTAPTSFKATPSPFESTVTLTWSGASGGTNNSISGYEIQCAKSEDDSTYGSWSSVTTDTSSPYVHTPTLTRGYYIKYRIRTRGSAGSSYYSEWKVSKALKRNSFPTTPPSISVDKTLVSSGDKVTITWGVSSDPDDNLSSYELQKSTDGGSTYPTSIYSGTNRSYTDTLSHSEGTVVKYRVRSKDSLDATSGWKVSSAVTINTTPTSPTDFSINKSEYSQGNSVKLSWESSSDVNGNISSYSLQYRVKSNDTWGSWKALASVLVPNNQYVFTPTQAGYHEYLQFRIRAVDELNATSGWTTSGTLYRNDTPLVHIHNGKTNSDYSVNIHDGSNWGKYMPYVHNGTSWQRYS